MYAIPLDAARQDAAPHGHTGTRAGGAGRGSGSSGGGSGSGSGSGATGSGASGSGSGATGSGVAGSGPGATAGGATGSGAAGSVGTHGGVGSTGNASKLPVLVPGGQPGSLIHSSNGFGSSPDVPGVNGSASAGLASVQSDSGSAPLIAILLAAVVLAIGAYVGVAAWRTHGSRAPKSAT